MKAYYIYFIVLIISCKQSHKNDTKLNNDKYLDTLESRENFTIFFNKFKIDKLFQVQRIDNPLSIVITEENSEIEEKKQVKYVSFEQKDWDVKIKYTQKYVNNDTINVVLEGIDTGVHIEHLFVCRNSKWYLFQIKNLSD